MATAVTQDRGQGVLEPAGAAGLAGKSSSVAIAAIASLFYLVYLLHAFSSGHDARSFIMLERSSLLVSHKSAVIKVEPGFSYARPGRGYDGQYYYMMALDPVNGRYYVVGGTYYYSRVLYPLIARALAVGQANLIPYTLILINLVSVVWATVMVAAWLRRKGSPPWVALIYAADSGVFVSFQRDLTEPLAYALLATGIWVLEFGGKRRITLSGFCFALAVLTRDKAAILALAFTLGFFAYHKRCTGMSRLWNMSRNVPEAVALGGMTLLPYAGLKLFLYLWMHSFIMAPGQQVAPFTALVNHYLVSAPSLLSDALSAMVPGLICLAMVIWALVRGARDLSLATLLLLVVVTTVTLNPRYFYDVVGLMRATILVVMAALYALPAVDRVTGGNRTWLYVCAAFWLSMTPSLFISSALYPWIQILTVLVVLLGIGLFVAGRRVLRALSIRQVTAG